MRASEARRLRPGDAVLWIDGPTNGPGVTGRVADANDNSIAIEWDDGETGVLHPYDMERVERVQ